MRATSPASSGASEMTPWCERNFQGGRNSGRVVAKISSGACAPRSASACSTSSEVGSAQCRSSNASTSGWVRALASTHAERAASWRLRNSSGESFGARPSFSCAYAAEWGRARFGGAEVTGEKRLAELEAALGSVGLDPAERRARGARGARDPTRARRPQRA